MLWPLPPLSMHRCLSCCAAASIATPQPLSLHQRLSHCASLMPAVGCCIVTSLAAPVPLLLCRRLSCCAAASLVAPHLHRLVVSLPTILTCHRLCCCTGWLSPCHLSLCLCASVSLFTISLIAPSSLWVIDPLNPSKKCIGFLGGLPLSIRRSGTVRKASYGVLEVECNFRQRRPWW